MNFKNLLLPLGSVLIIIGALFRIQHWPYGKQLYYSGFVLLVIYIIVGIYTGYKKMK